MDKIGEKQCKWVIICSFRTSFLCKTLSTGIGKRLNTLLPSVPHYFWNQKNFHMETQLLNKSLPSCPSIQWWTFTVLLWYTYVHTTMVWNCLPSYLMYLVQALRGAYTFCTMVRSAGYVFLGSLGLWQALQRYRLWLMTYPHYVYLLLKWDMSLKECWP